MNDRSVAATAGSWPGGGDTVQKLEYDGTIGALYWIYIKNLLLNIVTLSFYRFWGKTNIRRYVWAHTSVQGQRFEYTGRGGELFVGFLIVVAFYAVAAILLNIAILSVGEFVGVVGQLTALVLIVYFIFVAQYAAQNYRLTRTLWSGIRGGMTGSAWKYGIKAFLFMLLNLVTLNLAAPWTTLRLAEDRFNHSYFGNAKASLQASAGQLYLTFILGFVFTIVGVVVAMLIAGGVAYAVIMALDMMPLLQELQQANESGTEIEPTEEQKGQLALLIFVAVAIFYLGLAVVAIVAFAPYVAALFRAIANNLRLSELRFSSEVTAGRYIGLWLGNILIVMLTLGLGIPIAVHRSIRFFVDRVAIHGELDVDRLQQSSLERPKFGEGLLEAFDPGFI